MHGRVACSRSAPRRHTSPFKAGFAIEVVLYLVRDDDRNQLEDAIFAQVFGKQVKLEIAKSKGKHRSEFRDYSWS